MLEPVPEKVLCAPFADFISTFQDLTFSGFPSVREKSMLLWPASALGEKPSDSVAMLLGAGAYKGGSGLDLLGGLAAGEDKKARLAMPIEKESSFSCLPPVLIPGYLSVRPKTNII